MSCERQTPNDRVRLADPSQLRRRQRGGRGSGRDTSSPRGKGSRSRTPQPRRRVEPPSNEKPPARQRRPRCAAPIASHRQYRPPPRRASGVAFRRLEPSRRCRRCASAGRYSPGFDGQRRYGWLLQGSDSAAPSGSADRSRDRESRINGRTSTGAPRQRPPSSRWGRGTVRSPPRLHVRPKTPAGRPNRHVHLNAASYIPVVQWTCTSLVVNSGRPTLSIGRNVRVCVWMQTLESRQPVELAVEVFALLPDATRVRIILALREGELGVSQLVEIVVRSPAAMSQHLAKMRLGSGRRSARSSMSRVSGAPSCSRSRVSRRGCPTFPDPRPGVASWCRDGHPFCPPTVAAATPSSSLNVRGSG